MMGIICGVRAVRGFAGLVVMAKFLDGSSVGDLGLARGPYRADQGSRIAKAGERGNPA